MAQFSKKVQNFAYQYDLWKKNSKILLSVSGGPDSMCLLHYFYDLSKKYNLSLHIAHVNYRLRGADCEKDEELVRKSAEKLGVSLSVLKLKNKEYKGNLEGTLREIRYSYFEKIRKELKFDLVAVAHNQDDQAETVLMHILRGTGLNGLAAMRPKAGIIIRPLLKTSKKEILAYLKEKGVDYRIDKTNNDEKLTRNNIRHNLLPYLEKNFNPTIKKTLSELSLSTAKDYEYIFNQAERFDFVACTNKYATFSAIKFLKKHPSIQSQILRNAVLELTGNMDGLEQSHSEEVIKIIKSDKSKSQKTHIKGLNISKKGDIVEIFRIN